MVGVGTLTASACLVGMRHPVGCLPHPWRRSARAVASLLVATAACVPTGGEETPQPVETDSLDRRDSTLPARDLAALASINAPTPLRLTASDGTGLRLTSYKARGVVQGPLALTELHLTFENPTPRTIEGRFTIDLPQGSAISRFAMKIEEQWQEGEVVERQAARVAYEDFLHRKQDPALLENQAGDRFSARVFPIPANGRKELILSYSQELTDSQVPYSLRLAGLPELSELDVEIIVNEPGATSGQRVFRTKEIDYIPQTDLPVPTEAVAEVTLRHGNLAVARVRAAGDTTHDPICDLAIMFDTSASRALGFGDQVRRLGPLVEALGRDADFSLRVFAFDQELSLIYKGNARDFGLEQLNRLYSRRALGASDLAGALASVATEGTARVLVMSDGVTTAGKSEVADLKDAALALSRAGVQRIDALVDGGLRDEDALAAVTNAGLATDGVVVDAQLPPEAVVDRLTHATLTDIAVSVPSSSFHWPHTLQGLQPGDEALIYAELPADAVMTVVLEGKHTVTKAVTTEVTLRAAEAPLLQRSLISARIDAMTLRRSELATDATEARETLKEDIVALSTKHRVLSDFTALLVLETEEDYRRFKIDRAGLSGVMHVGASGIELLQRKPRTKVQNPTATWVGRAPLIRPGIPRGAELWDVTADGSGDNDDSVLLTLPHGSGHFLASPHGAAFALGGDDDDVWGGNWNADGSLRTVHTGRGGGGVAESRLNVDLVDHDEAPDIADDLRVTFGKTTAGPGLKVGSVRRVVRNKKRQLHACYATGRARNPSLSGRLDLEFMVGSHGKVTFGIVARSTADDHRFEQCVIRAIRRSQFPEPTDGLNTTVTHTLVFDGPDPVKPPPPPDPEELRRERARAEARVERMRRHDTQQKELRRTHGSPYSGRTFDVMTSLDHGATNQALSIALGWRDEAPTDVLALVALGEALEAVGQPTEAARAYGSLIDLFPARADLRRYAGARLDGVGTSGRLAIDTYRRALEQRGDHPSGHRLYAYALARAGQYEAAFEAITQAQTRHFSDRYPGVARILSQDAEIIGAAWLAAAPTRSVQATLDAHDVVVATSPSTRFVVNWETDTNDVDLHVRDRNGAHAFFGAPELASGGKLYSDIVHGYGPECFAIQGPATAYPYDFEVHYYARGPMGYGRTNPSAVTQQDRDRWRLRAVARRDVIARDRDAVAVDIVERQRDGLAEAATAVFHAHHVCMASRRPAGTA